MEKYEVLTKCESKELSSKKAYRELYAQERHYKLPRANFVKISIRINGHPGLSVFLAFLFAFPIPIGIVRMFLRRKSNEIISDSFPMTYGQLISDFMVKGITIDVDAKHEAKVHIKTI